MKKFTFIIGTCCLLQGLIAAPSWTPPGLNLGSLDAGGGLHRELLIGSLNGSQEFPFPITLRHRTLRNQDGFSAVSEWIVPQLTSFVAPQGRKDIIWIEPGGATHLFAKKDLEKRAKQPLPRGWTGVDEGNGDYSFHSHDGWVYRYERGLLKSLTAPTGRNLEFETEGGRIMEIVQRAGDGSMELLSASYNNDGKLVTLTLGPVTHEFVYDRATGQLQQWTSASRPEAPFQFQYISRLLSALRLPDGKIQRFQWESDRAALGRRFDDFKIPREAAGAILLRDDDYLYRFGLNEDGINLIREDKLGKIDSLTFNPNTGEKITRDRSGGEQIFIWNGEREKTGAGLLKEVRAPDGRVLVQYQYDELGRIVAQKTAGKPTRIIQYDDEGRILAVGRPGQKLTAFEYEKDARRPFKVTDALGGVQLYEYNDAGQVTTLKDKRGGIHRFRYDDFGRLLEREMPYGLIQRFRYDKNGNLVERTDPDGSVTVFAYDDFGRLIGTKDDQETRTLAYDAVGRVEQVMEGDKVLTSIQRVPSAGGEQVTVTGPDGTTVTRELDQAGRVLREIDPLGQEIAMNYDPAGQLTGWTDARGVEAVLQRDEVGRVTSVADSLGAEMAMVYDIGGKLRYRETAEQAVSYRYDREGRVRGVHYGDDDKVTYTYDDYGRIAKVSTEEVVTEYAYDALDRVIGERHLLPDGTETKLIYAYNPAGDRTMMTIIRSDGLEKTTRYQHDLLGRVTEVSVNGEKGVVYQYDLKTSRLEDKWLADGTRLHYDYDAKGRIRAVTSYGEENQVLKIIHYRWDEQGRLSGRATEIPDRAPTEGLEAESVRQAEAASL